MDVRGVVFVALVVRHEVLDGSVQEGCEFPRVSVGCLCHVCIP